MGQVRSLLRKELDIYFGSPVAIIFVGTFLAVTLYLFFWLDSFWLRGLADVRPLFRWMPLLLIFLMAALTMRQWSEEQRTGTLELLLTLPVATSQLVLAKFLSVLIMALAALALTLPLPLTVSLLGDLDWGPVWAGYLAALLLAAAYAAIGLCLSSRTDNQLVALISTLLLGGTFYLIGTRGLTDFTGTQFGNVLRAFGTGSRFESIERGVIDLRDLVYYLSLTLTFLMLNVLSLEAKRWSRSVPARPRRLQKLLLAGLIATNLVLTNVWLHPLRVLRADTTSSRAFTLSSATTDLLGTLQEPLLVRAYVSGKTHPLLAPLAPQLADMLREYEIAARGSLSGEVVDPAFHPEIEAEANQTYGIQPTPFRVADRYESSVINSYFDILVRYGDQSVTLGADDLISLTAHRDGGVEVGFRNLEYDLTSAIKRVVYGFQSVEAILSSLDEPAHLRLIVTPALLPDIVRDAPSIIVSAAEQIGAEAGGKFTFETIDPDAASATLDRQMLLEDYGLRPYPVSFFSADSYFLHMLLQVGSRVELLFPAGDLTEGSIRTAIESGLRRGAPGFLKVVGLWTPTPVPAADAFGQPRQQLSSWHLIGEQLHSEYALQLPDLGTGQVPAEIDVLLLIAPQRMSDKARYAVDQYLMRGGSVVVAHASHSVTPDPFSGEFRLSPVEGGLGTLLAHYGIELSQMLVMDPQNEPFPIAIERQANGATVREIQTVPYPYFVDVRSDGMDRGHPLLAGLNAVTLNWTSPITLDAAKNADRDATDLLRSTAFSWLRSDANIQPDFALYPDFGFPIEGEVGPRTLAVAVQGPFESYFRDRPSPWTADVPASTSDNGPADAPGVFLDQSVADARLVVFGSAHFVDDFVLELSRSLLGSDRFLNNLFLMQNAVDWSVEDLELLTIRARGGGAPLLFPLAPQQQSAWELVNYLLALAALLALAFLWRWRKRQGQPIESGPSTRHVESQSETDRVQD